MDNADLTQPAFVFWMRCSKLRPGGVTRFDRLDDAVNCVMQHALARTAPVAWIKTMNRHLDMDQIRNIARHSGLVSYLSKSEQGLSACVESAAPAPGASKLKRRQRAPIGREEAPAKVDQPGLPNQRGDRRDDHHAL